MGYHADACRELCCSRFKFHMYLKLLDMYAATPTPITHANKKRNAQVYDRAAALTGL